LLIVVSLAVLTSAILIQRKPGKPNIGKTRLRWIDS
jgi:hypothetical protein